MMFKNFHKNKYNKGPTRNALQRKAGGVTIIELLVVISIFMVISSITVFSYGKFNSSLSIQNLSDDIALSVRRAQGYAIGVRSANNAFDIGYGIHLTANPNTSDLANGSSKSFVLFADVAGGINKVYNHATSGCPATPTASNECLEILSIKSADKISEIYYNDTNLIAPTSSIDLLFKRPSPEPTFCYRVGGGNSCDSTSISNIKIRISSDADPSVYKIVTISNNGQISVSN